MGKFIVEPHFRLQEWIAEEKGYFKHEGLDYEFRELIRSTERVGVDTGSGRPLRSRVEELCSMPPVIRHG